MPAAFKASLGSSFNNVSGTTLAITTTAAIAIGDLVVVRWAADNLSATTPTATCADGGNTYTVQRQAAANATAAAGIAGGILTSLATVARPSGSTITLTFSGAIVGKAAYAESFSNVASNTLRIAAVGSSATTGTAATSGASAAGVVSGDLVLGFSAVQTRVAATGDTDTTNGAWSTKVGVNGGGTSGQDGTSVQINGQYKIANAAGAQTYDNTVTSTYWITGLIVMQGAPDPTITQAAYRFYADGTETASTALAAENTSYAVDVSSGDLNLLVRMRLQATTAVAIPATDDWQLQYERNANGAWADATTGTAGPTWPFSNTTNLYNMGKATSGYVSFGESFMGDGSSLSRAEFLVAKVASPVGFTLKAELWSHSGTFGTTGLPSALLATSELVDASTLPVNYTSTGPFTSFRFATPYTLANGTAYFILVTSTQVGDDVNYFNIASTGSGAYAGGAAYRQNNLAFGAFSAGIEIPFALYSGGDNRIVGYNSANLTDGAATTNRLTAGTGSFVAGKVSEDSVADDMGWTASNFTEVLYAVTLKQSLLSHGDTVRFRVLRNGASQGITYTQVPTLTVTKIAALSTLTDDFATSVDKAQKWSGSFGGVTWDATGRVKVQAGGGYDSLYTPLGAAAGYSIIGSSVFVQVFPPALGNGTRDTMLVVSGITTAQQELSLYIEGSNLISRTIVAGTRTTLRTAAYDSVNHAWFRIRESGGTIYWDTSPDSITWTNFTSVATSAITWDLTRVAVGLTAGFSGSETVDYAYFDNVNLTTDVSFDTTTIPTWHTGFGSLTASSSVTLPAGKVILVAVLADGDSSPTQTASVSTSGAALTWTKVVERNGATAGSSYSAYAGIFRTIGDGTAHVITATIAYSKAITCMAVICDNVESTNPTGAVGNAETASQDASIATYTSTVAKSRGFGCAMDWSNGSGATSTDTATTVAVTGTGDGLFIRKAASTATPGTAVSFNVKQTLTPNWLVVSAEMLPTGTIATGGRPKVYTGAAWATKPLKIWTGSAWVEKPVKVWTGSVWKKLT